MGTINKKEQERNARKPVPARRIEIAERLRKLNITSWAERNRTPRAGTKSETLGKKHIRKGRPTVIYSKRKPFVGNLKQAFKFGSTFSNKDRRSMSKRSEKSVGRTIKRKRWFQRLRNWFVSLFKKKKDAGQNN